MKYVEDIRDVNRHLHFNSLQGILVISRITSFIEDKTNRES